MRRVGPEHNWRKGHQESYHRQHTRADRRIADPSTLLYRPPVLSNTDAQLFGLASTLPPLERSLVESFIRNHGPKAVINSVVNDRELYYNDFTPEESNYETLMVAIGIVHDRIAHATLGKLLGQKDYIILDPGAGKRLSRAIDYTTGIYLNLKGAILTGVDSNPTLQAVCEYKANPQSPRTLENLPGRLHRLTSFLDSYRGKSIDLEALIDIRARTSFDHIEISQAAQVALLAPIDRPPTQPLPPNVIFMPTPLSRHILHTMADICTKDLPPLFPKTGSIL